MMVHTYFYVIAGRFRGIWFERVDAKNPEILYPDSAKSSTARAVRTISSYRFVNAYTAPIALENKDSVRIRYVVAELLHSNWCIIIFRFFANAAITFSRSGLKVCSKLQRTWPFFLKTFKWAWRIFWRTASRQKYSRCPASCWTLITAWTLEFKISPGSTVTSKDSKRPSSLVSDAIARYTYARTHDKRKHWIFPFSWQVANKKHKVKRRCRYKAKKSPPFADTFAGASLDAALYAHHQYFFAFLQRWVRTCTITT